MQINVSWAHRKENLPPPSRGAVTWLQTNREVIDLESFRADAKQMRVRIYLTFTEHNEEKKHPLDLAVSEVM